jgi:hypothetical protein
MRYCFVPFTFSDGLKDTSEKAKQPRARREPAIAKMAQAQLIPEEQ